MLNFIAIVYMISAQTVIEKSTFDIKFDIKFDLAVKKGQDQPRFTICANLVGAHIQTPNAIGLLDPEKEILKGVFFLPYMVKAAIIDDVTTYIR